MLYFYYDGDAHSAEKFVGDMISDLTDRKPVPRVFRTIHNDENEVVRTDMTVNVVGVYKSTQGFIVLQTAAGEQITVLVIR